MSTVQFNGLDAALLSSFPKPPSELAKIVWYYTFINRIYPPSFDELKSCLTKGLRAGIIRRDNELYVIDNDWYGRIHMADATAENKFAAMEEFENGFVGVDFDETTDASCTLTEDEYESILAKLRR